MESVGFEESAGGGSRSSTVAWPYVNATSCCDFRAEIDIHHDTCEPMKMSPWPGMARDHFSGRWKPLSIQLPFSGGSPVIHASDLTLRYVSFPRTTLLSLE